MGAPEGDDDLVVPSSPVASQRRRPAWRSSLRRSLNPLRGSQSQNGVLLTGNDDDTVPGSPASQSAHNRTFSRTSAGRRRGGGVANKTPEIARNVGRARISGSDITPGTADSILSEDLDVLADFKTPTSVGDDGGGGSGYGGRASSAKRNAAGVLVRSSEFSTPETSSSDGGGSILSQDLEFLVDFKTPKLPDAEEVQPKRIRVDVSPLKGNRTPSTVEMEFSRPPAGGRAEEDVSYASGQFHAVLMNRLRRTGSDILTADSVNTTTDSLAFSGEEGSFFGLPSVVKAILETERGIRDLYDWQRELLQTPEVEAGRNVLLSLPTSGGKTLIAELLLLRTILKQKKNCLFILPYVSIVQEKVRALAAFGMNLDFLVEEYAGSKGAVPPVPRRLRNSVYVATIEKACGVVHHLVKDGRLGELGLVVVDEVHMLGEPGRGATLEMTLAKVLHCAPDLQVVGMSATVGNLDEVGAFLRAFVYRQKFRPVALREYVVLGAEVYEPCPEENKLTYHRTLQPKFSEERRKEDPDLIGHLVLEVVPLNSVLIFCPSRVNCENVAKMVIKSLPRKKASEHRREEKAELLQCLKRDSGGRLCPVLMQTVPFGVAYHHSGLTDDERRLIEEAFLQGVLCVICCTSTLAAGVNLPARRVILRSPFVGREFLTRSRYKQMAGRAGRAGFDSEGESYLVCDHANVSKVLTLFDGPAENAISSLNGGDGYPLRYFVLSCVVEKVATTPSKVLEVAKCTLWARQAESEEVVSEGVTQSLRWLVAQGLLRVKTSAESNPAELDVENDVSCAELSASDLGQAAIKGCIGLDQAQVLYNDLRRGLDALVLNTPLHILYLLTPYEIASDMNPDRSVFFDEYHRCSAHDVRVFDLVGISPVIVQKYFHGREFAKEVSFTIRRMYCALMLLAFWKQGEQVAGRVATATTTAAAKADDDESQPIWRVATAFSVDRGRVQALLSRASSFGSNVLHFVQELEPLRCYANLLPSFVERIGRCSTMELVPLLQLPAVKRARARLLYDAGFKSPADVARAAPRDLVSAVGRLSMKAAKEIIVSAQMLVTENALSLQEAANSALAVLDQFSTVRNLAQQNQGTK